MKNPKNRKEQNGEGDYYLKMSQCTGGLICPDGFDYKGTAKSSPEGLKLHLGSRKGSPCIS